MTWFDVVAILLVGLIAWLESVRGFGRALLDLVGGLIALKVASFVAAPLGTAAPLFQSPDTSTAFWHAAIFLILASLTVLASKLIYETTLLSLDVLDPLVGGVLGLGCGIVVAHIFLKTLVLGFGESEAADVLIGTFVGQELLKFRSYHTVVTALQNLGNW